MTNLITTLIKSKTVMHVLAWLFIFTLVVMLTFSQFEGWSDPESLKATQFFRLRIISFGYWIISFYMASIILADKIFNQKKYIQSFIIFICYFAALMIVHKFIYTAVVTVRPYRIIPSILHHTPSFLLATAIGLLYRMISDRLEEEKNFHIREEENLKTELSFLKSQISPHFIFNVLNNIVALVRLDSKELEPTVMKLSSLMRYMLYETKEDKVLINTEAQYLQAYIDLQKQRFGAKIDISTDINIEDDAREIEPMLLIPFVENAFKHGTKKMSNPYIKILLNATKDTLTFKVTNNYNEDLSEEKDNTSGIGLPNVERRLSLLYGDNHELKITKENGIFDVYLGIKF